MDSKQNNAVRGDNPVLSAQNWFVNKWCQWLIFTVFMGLLSPLCRLILMLIYGRSILLETFYPEIFFFVIAILVDSIKNFILSKTGICIAIAVFILILSVLVYACIILASIGVGGSMEESVVNKVMILLVVGCIVMGMLGVWRRGNS